MEKSIAELNKSLQFKINKRDDLLNEIILILQDFKQKNFVGKVLTFIKVANLILSKIEQLKVKEYLTFEDPKTVKLK